MKLILTICVAVLIKTGTAYYFSINEMNYFVSCPMKQNWHMANKYCLENGMYLVDIPNVQEEVRLLSLVLRPEYQKPIDRHFWTSGTDQGREGRFYWATTGLDIEYTSWHYRQPDNNYNQYRAEWENCIILQSDAEYRWADHMCSEEHSFICRNITNPPVKDSLHESLLMYSNLIL